MNYLEISLFAHHSANGFKVLLRGTAAMVSDTPQKKMILLVTFFILVHVIFDYPFNLAERRVVGILVSGSNRGICIAVPFENASRHIGSAAIVVRT